MNPEEHHLTTYYANTYAAGWYSYELNGVFEGYSVHQRVGRKTWMKRLNFSLTSTPTGGGQQNGFMRIMFVFDRQPTGVNPIAVPEIVDTNNGITANYNEDNCMRFTILFDRIYKLNATTNGGSPNVVERVTIPIGQEVTYKGVTGSLVDITTGALYIYIYKTRSSDLEFECRLFFTDL